MLKVHLINYLYSFNATYTVSSLAFRKETCLTVKRTYLTIPSTPIKTPLIITFLKRLGSVRKNLAYYVDLLKLEKQNDKASLVFPFYNVRETTWFTQASYELKGNDKWSLFLIWKTMTLHKMKVSAHLRLPYPLCFTDSRKVEVRLQRGLLSIVFQF